MTVQKTKHTSTLSRTAQLMGGASIAVLMTYGPANAQAVNITVDSGTNPRAFTAANVTGFETVANSTQESLDAIEASILNGSVTSGSGNTISSSATVADNSLSATATGNVSSLNAAALSTEGDGTSGTLGALSGQFADGTVSTSITNSGLSITTGAATGSSADASLNAIAANTSVNRATTVFADDIGADLASDLAQSGASFASGTAGVETLTRGDLGGSGRSLGITGGASIVASTQAITGDGVDPDDDALSSAARITNSNITITLNDGSAATDAGTSALSVSENTLRATLAGNTAATGTDVTVDTLFDGAAGVFSQQQIGTGAVDPIALTASTTDSDLTIALADSTASSLTVSENVLGAQARGNVATRDGNGLGATENVGTFLNIDANEIASTTFDATGSTNATAGRVAIDSTAGTVVFDDGAGTPADTGFDFIAATQQSVAGVAESENSITAENQTSTLSVTAGTTGVLDGTALSIEDNTFFALGAANTGSTGVDLTATTITASAAVANDQSVTNNDVNALVGTTVADFDGSGGAIGFDAGADLTASITGTLGASSVNLDDNTSIAEAMGNVGRTGIEVTATTIDRTVTGAASGAGTTSLNLIDITTPVAGAARFGAADFATLNNQVQRGEITALNATDTSVSAAVATNSAVTADRNTSQADAMSNVGTNSVRLDGVAGISEATTSLGSVQITGTPPDIEAFIFSGVNSSADVTVAGLNTSSASVDGNQAFASAASNRVTNDIALTGNAISGAGGTALASVGVALLPQVGALAVADNSLASNQISVAGLLSTSVQEGNLTTGAGGIVSSSASISDNFARALGMGNEATNRLGLIAGTSAAGANALTGNQVQIGDVASIALADSDLDATSGVITGSSAEVDGNIAFAQTMGNDQTNALSVAASTITGVSDAAGDNAEIGGLGAALTVAREVDGDNTLIAVQSLLGDISGVAGVNGDVLTDAGITGSSISASENIAQSNVTGNRGNNLLNLAAETAVGGASALASEQLGATSEQLGATSAVTSAASLVLNITGGATSIADSSAFNVDGNIGVSSAFGNDVANALNVTGNSVSGLDGGLSTAGIDAGGIVTGDSDNLIGNVQTRGAAAVTSAASLNSAVLQAVTPSAADGDSLLNSSVSIADNILDSTATSNRASNTLALNAATALTAGGAIANQQNSASAVTSDVVLRASVGGDDGADPAVITTGALTGSSIVLRDNTGIARAAGNDAVNVLNARAGTAITGVVGSGSSTVGAGGLLNASGTFATASNQVNSGAVTARASVGTDPATTISSLGVQTAALNSSSVDLSGNRLVADAVSNRVVNSMSVSGRSPSTLVSTALTTRQVASGAVTSQVDSFRVASTNAALTSSSVGLSGNTFSASAGGNSAVSRLIRD